MRLVTVLAAVMAVSACTTEVPDSGAGVGFGNYDEYQAEKARRDAQLAGSAVPAPTAVSDERLGGQPPVVVNDSSDLAADTQAALQGGQQAGADGGFVQASPTNPAPVAVNSNTGISQENDFDAVGQQRSIESDAQKIASNRAQYRVIEAEALPSRPGGDGPNIVDYALATKHPRGTQVYRRIGMGLEAKAQRNCAKYASSDQAQSDFLGKGGPKRDKLGLDPDGDGYACAWDPRPFRKAVGG